MNGFLPRIARLGLLLGAFGASAPGLAAAPDAPGNVRFTINSPTSATIAWDAPSDPDGIRGYLLSRNGASIGFKSAVEFRDNALLPGRRFTYRVVALDNTGERSTPAVVSLVTPSNRPAVAAPAPAATAAGAPAPTGPTAPRGVRLSVYSDTAAELFWEREPARAGLSVEVFRDGRSLGTTSGTSWFDAGRTGRDHVYTLYAEDRRGARSAGVRVPSAPTAGASAGGAPVASTGGGARPLAPVVPGTPRLPARGDGTDVFLLNGQSNANPQLLSALTDVLGERGFDFATGHYYGGGIPLAAWIEEDGTKVYRWPIMMSVFDGATAACESDPGAIRSITLVHYQGEADVNSSASVAAAAAGRESAYARRLRAFVGEFTRHFERRCGITPNVVLAMVSYIESHPLFPARLAGAHALIRNEIRTVATEFPNAGAFDTLDLAHADHVHLALYPGSDAQRTAAERAVDLFFR